jgi:iron complex outermembrane recepter protein
MKLKLIFSMIIINLLALNLAAQQDTIKPNLDTEEVQELSPVTISATRYENASAVTPFAISVLNQNQIQKGQQKLSLNESLLTVPGVFTMNPDNFTQDLRISIRGYGARAAFGIRGVRLIVDGIPESTPDGQADVDNLDMGAMQQLEILRGAASGMYGNAAGGVLYLQTEEASDKPFVETQLSAGSYGFWRFQGKTGFKAGSLSHFYSVAHNNTVGFRAQSTMRQTVFNGKWRYEISPSAKISLLVNYSNSPLAEDPGSLTQLQIDSSRQQARFQNVQFNGGESVEQGRVGLIFDKKFSPRQSLKIRGFVTKRSFANRLAFKAGGVVEIDRTFGGGGIQYEFQTAKFKTQIGIETDRQNDFRKRFDNNNGTKDKLAFEQTEQFGSVGSFIFSEYRPHQKWQISTALRYDLVNLGAKDHFLNDGNQSGDTTFRRLNPSLGVVFKATPSVSLYGNASFGFETPTLNELSANPSNTGGFNPNLNPQQSINYEIGSKFRLSPKFQGEIAFFHIDLTNESVPYQLAAFPGRTYFRNAGTSQRNGIELALNMPFHEWFSATVNYTFSDFTYKNYEVNGVKLDGNRQPALPQHLLFGEFRMEQSSSLFLILQGRFVSSVFTDDANKFTDKDYTTFNARLGFTRLFRGQVLEPYFGVNNIFSRKYNANVVINAVGNRFFEPAAGAYFFGGLKWRWQKRG